MKASLKYTLSFLFLLVAYVIPVSAVTPQELLTKAAANYKNAGGIEAQFNLASGGKKISGSIKSAGAKFAMKMSDGHSIWCDGKTLSSYNPVEKEVTYETPDANDLAALNPYGIIMAAPSTYTASLLQSKSNNLYRLKLTPKMKSMGGQTIELYLDKSNLMPMRLVGQGNGKRYGIEIKKYTKGKKFTAADFVFPKNKYKGVKINDLR